MGKNIAIYGLAIALCVSIGFAFACGIGRGAGRDLERVASLAEEVRVASEELRADYRRAIDELEYLRTNNREAGRSLVDLRVENSELAIRNRELVEYAGKLEGDLIAAGVDIERVAEEIGAWVPVE